MSNRSVSVAYDISVLGRGAYDQTARTGVARVVEELSLALWAQGSIDLTFCAGWTPLHCIQALKYLETGGPARATGFSGPRSRLLRALVRTAKIAYPDSDRRTVAQRALDILLQPAGLVANNFAPQGLSGHALYHSTFYPLPKRGWRTFTGRQILTVYDLIPVLFPQYFKPTRRRFMKTLLASIGPGDRLLAISRSTRADLCEYAGIDAERISVTHLAASDSFYPCTDEARIAQARNRYGIPEGRYALSLCTIEPRKNIDQTIRSFVNLVNQERMDDLNLVLVGTRGWDFDRVFEAISGASDLGGRIVTTGYVPDPDLAPLYSGATMFVYPSFYEGFGLPPLEAMQCGVPVITSNTSSLPEVVGDAGIMVDPADGEALSQAMLELCSSAELRAEYRARGIEKASEFSWRRCAEQTTAAYMAALDA